MPHFRSNIRQGFFLQRVIRQKLIQLKKTFIIFCNTHVEQAVFLSKFDAQNWFDPLFFTTRNKFISTRGVVDICQHQSFYSHPFCCCHQLFGRQRSVLQTEVAVYIQIHFPTYFQGLLAVLLKVLVNFHYT